MTSDLGSTRHEGAWQFSLKSLMFVTTIVAICAALVSISIVLAVVFVPLIVAGLARTIHVVAQQARTGSKKPGLVVTFCNSIALVVATISVGLATISVAAMAAVLAAMMVTIHVLRAARPIYQPLARRLGQLLLQTRGVVFAFVSRIQLVGVLRWLQVHAVARTLTLLSTSRRLFQQCWSGTTT
jgi:hypothetical protein